MASYLPYDVQSLLPGHKGKPSPLPEIGSQAPNVAEGSTSTPGPALVAFVRHCGCPFAQAEVESLARVHKAHANVNIFIIAHSQEDVVKDWFGRIGKPKFADMNKVNVIADPEYRIYDRFGIGQLGWSGLFSLPMIGELRTLASQGIKNTKTGQGSNRWQNSGGFAIDDGGVVRWNKVAAHAGDTCNYEEAVKTVLPK